MAGAGANLWLEALGAAAGGCLRDELFATPLHAARLNRPLVPGLAGVSGPKGFRPADAALGRGILDGEWVLADQTLALPQGGDPWNRPSPSRTFAAQLHRMDWLGDLIAAGEPGTAEALRQVLAWRRLFGRWNAFVWRPDILDRRVFNLACHIHALAAIASEREGQRLAETLAAQARHLMRLDDALPRAAERLTAAAVAAVSIAGAPGDQMLDPLLPRLGLAVERAVLADGAHASRSPQAGLELLLDLLTLDDGLSRLGREPQEKITHAIDRLTAAARFFTRVDGRLSAFHGGEPGSAAQVAAARAQERQGGGDNPLTDLPHGGYQRMAGPHLSVMVDAGAPAQGGWSLEACGQPGAIEIMAGRDRLVEASPWGLGEDRPQALRLAPAGSTASLGTGEAGAPLGGFLARALGPRLVRAAAQVEVWRHEGEEGVWVELAHDGWREAFGLIHERRLFLSRQQDELRGEDRFSPRGPAASPRVLAAQVSFLLNPKAQALVSRDQRSVLIRGRDSGGWWLRHDAGEVALEPAVLLRRGVVVHSSRIVLRGRLRADEGGRVRWKLAAAEPA